MIPYAQTIYQTNQILMVGKGKSKIFTRKRFNSVILHYKYFYFYSIYGILIDFFVAISNYLPRVSHCLLFWYTFVSDYFQFYFNNNFLLPLIALFSIVFAPPPLPLPIISYMVKLLSQSSFISCLSISCFSVTLSDAFLLKSGQDPLRCLPFLKYGY